MVVKKPWADGPFELIPTPSALVENSKDVHLLARMMMAVHNVLLRGANSIYLQCVNVEKSPSAVPDFVGYAVCWVKQVDVHHQVEEEGLFLAVERATGVPGLMGGSVAQHRAFHDGLERMLAYLPAVQAGAEQYSGARLRAAIDAFMPALRRHLVDEIDALAGLDEYEDRLDWGRWYKDEQTRIQKKEAADPLARTEVYHAYWPPIPWFAGLVLRWLYVPKHKNWWQFCPCNAYGQPRDMPFAE